jgi:hypothetical protein
LGKVDHATARVICGAAYHRTAALNRSACGNGGVEGECNVAIVAVQAPEKVIPEKVILENIIGIVIVRTPLPLPVAVVGALSRARIASVAAVRVRCRKTLARHVLHARV